MSTMRSMRRQSMYRYQWVNRGRRAIQHPEIVPWRQRLWAGIMGFFSSLIGRGR